MAKIRDKQPDADAGRKIVDEQLEGLEARLTSMYRNTAKEVQADLDKFLDKYKKDDAEKKTMVEAGELTEKEYLDWRERQIFRTNSMKAKIDDLTARVVNADKQAMAMVNDQLPETYATSYNFGGYRGETMSGAAGFDYTQFTIINQDAVKELATKDPDLIPWKSDVDVPEDTKWNRKHVQEAVFQGITKGDSMDDVAKRLLPVVNMNRNAAIRTARTAVNGIENKGRKDATERVREAGIPMVETWSCTHDDRTRDTHILLDGTVADDNGMFGKGILSILMAYPGDPAGDPSEVYNCRCGLVSSIKGIDHSKDNELYAQMMEEEYFEDWVQVKEDRQEKETAFQIKKEGAAERVAAKQSSQEEQPEEKPEMELKEYSDREKAQVLEAYVAEEGFAMNAYARGENIDRWKGLDFTPQEVVEHTEKFTDILENERLDKEERVYRGATFDSIIQSTGFTEEQIREDPSILNGQTITEKGFMSATPTYSMAEEYAGGNVVLRIDLPEGAKAIHQNEYLDYIDGKETTIQRDCDLKISFAYTTEDEQGREIVLVQAEYIDAGLNKEQPEKQPAEEKEPEIEEKSTYTYAGHKDDDDTQYIMANHITDEGEEKIAKDLNVSTDEARDMGNAICDYSGWDFQYVRYASIGDIDAMHRLEEENEDWIDVDELIKKAEDIEKFIDLSPKWDGGSIERGIHIKDEGSFDAFIQQAQNGDAIDLKGMTSWTSNGDIASNFAETWDKKSYSVILKTNDTQTEFGTSIRHLSRSKEEDEVLVSKNADFIPTRVEKQEGVVYIYGDLRRKK